MISKKTNAVYKFVREYSRNVGTKENVTIQLHIDYESKQFSITTFTGNKDFQFTSSGGNRDYEKWIATAECIKEATEFGAQEIGLKSKPPVQV